MNKPLSAELTTGTCSESADKLLSSEDAPGGHSSQAMTFNCDTCEQIAPIDEAVTSPVLSCSRFCSTDCRDEAELAAENARHL